MSLIPFFDFDFDRQFRLMNRDFGSENFYSPFSLVPRGFFAPEFFKPFDNYMRQIDEMTNAMSRVGFNELRGSSVTADDEKFQINVDVQHFAPEEVTVKVVDGHVLVEGKHEEKRDHHGYVSRQFVRRYTLPQGCLPDAVVSKLSSDGVLTVTAPKVLPLPSIGEKIIPITHTGPVKKQIGEK